MYEEEGTGNPTYLPTYLLIQPHHVVCYMCIRTYILAYYTHMHAYIHTYSFTSLIPDSVEPVRRFEC